MELPKDFLHEIALLLGKDEADALCRALTESPVPTSVRINTLKRPTTLPASTDSEVPWCETGVYLSERPKFTYDPMLPTLYHRLCSTFVLHQVVRARFGEVYCPQEHCL